MSVRVAIGALCALATLCTTARAATDPARQWMTLRSTHFAIHTYDDGVELARKVAAYAEEAWETLNPVLGWEPSETVHIRLVDDVDGSNGLASVVPYPVITLWAHPPPMDSDLADHTDWMRLLVLHEYAHIAHLDHATGIPRVLNTVFGKVIKPNGALPRWLTEGIATWAESRHGPRGRLDSSRYKMMLRMAVLDDQAPSLAELTGKPLRPPRGDAWYLYGAHLVDQVVRDAGPEALRAFIEAYGRRLVAYGMNIISRQSTGADLVQWHGRMLREAGATARETRDAVLSEGLQEGQRLTHGGEARRWPRFTPDGQHLVYVRSDAHSASRLVRRGLDSGGDEAPIAFCDGGCGRFAVSPDGAHLLATMGRPYRKVNHYKELVRLPLQTDQPRGAGEQLTRGIRAEAPVWSPDGDEVWVVRNRWGRTWLESLDVRSWKTVRRWDPPEGARIDGPVPHDDGRLFLSMHVGGNRDLVEVNPATGVWSPLTSGASLEIDPVLSPGGRWLVYASDTTGIYNLYARDVSAQAGSAGRTYRLTNVLGGAFSPTISPDGASLVYVGWTAEGEELFSLPFRPERGVAVSEPDQQAPRVSAPVRPTPDLVQQTYESLPTLLPRSWAPSLVASSQGLSTVGLSLAGVDASRRVGTTLAAEWNAASRSLAAWARLDLGTGWSDLRWSAGRYTADQPQLAGDLLSRVSQEVLFTTLGISTRFPAPVTGSTLGANVTAALHRAVGGPLQPIHAPDAAEAVIPADGLRTSLKLSWSFNDVRRYPYSISTADGVSGGVSFRLKVPQPARSGLVAHQLRYHLRAYGTMPWLEDHVVALILRGGWSGGAAADEEPFRLGGTPTQDLVSALMLEVQTGSHWLRGYPSDILVGRAFHLVTAEYRLPLGRIRRGLDTLPIFARDLSFALFHDLGVAYAAPLSSPEGLATSARGAAGAEVRLTTDLFFALPLRLRFGWAWGWGPGGGHQGYLVLASDP